ncbi:notchless protein homolog 1-like [Watersipora subatra]|uniref:notchless protein homolog 1-like n=1 Tax=Watersipora subatra TaxID=2589382 RepID=UPI00355B890C
MMDVDQMNCDVVSSVMETEDKHILVQFKSENGDSLGTPFDMPTNLSKERLQRLCDALLQSVERTPYKFYVNDIEITSTLAESLDSDTLEASEKVLEIVYQPQAVFKVRAVTRCTSTIEGHAEAVISVSFSPDGRYLASGSGDTTVRFWDLQTETPHHTCKGHKQWVLCIAWSPDANKLASACKKGQVCIWQPETGKQIGKTLIGHKQWITSLSWKPLHLDGECRLLASASKDGTVRIWDTVLSQCRLVLSGHSQSVTCLKWGGTNLIYTGSQDRTIKVWRSEDGVLCRTLQGHAHWVNTLALNTDYILRTGAYDPSKATIVYSGENSTPVEKARKAMERYEVVKGSTSEVLVTGSDDFTLIMWHPEVEKKPIARLTGHQQLINEVLFSPDTRLIASASFDKSIKLWDGKTGKYLASLRGHVNRVYQIAWSADSRLLCSGSSDSTLKLWNVETRKILNDLPGHADEVYAVDWSPDGQRVASGGKDKVLKIWRQ